MRDEDRGLIRNPAVRMQLADYRGLRWGKITPTDLDGFIDFQDGLFVFFEAKAGDAPFEGGQRRALERLCDRCDVPRLVLRLTDNDTRLAPLINDDIGIARMVAVAFVVSHWTAPGDQIDMAKAKVNEIRWEGKWSLPLWAEGQTLRQAIDLFLDQRSKGLRARELVGEPLVSLVTGERVSSHSVAWRRETAARQILRMPAAHRVAFLADVPWGAVEVREVSAVMAQLSAAAREARS